MTVSNKRKSDGYLYSLLENFKKDPGVLNKELMPQQYQAMQHAGISLLLENAYRLKFIRRGDEDRGLWRTDRLIFT